MDDGDYAHYLKTVEKYFKPKLPPYQLRRMKYKSLDEIESHDIPHDAMDSEDEDTEEKMDPMDSDYDGTETIKQATTTKQLRTDTTLRFRQKHSRKTHSSPVTAIHTSIYTDQHIWTASSNGEIRQWSLHRSEDHWINDNEVTNCPKCKAQFGVLERRHHCRKCGNIFCHKCSNNRMDLPDMGYGEPVRVCDYCFERETTRFLSSSQKQSKSTVKNLPTSPPPDDEATKSNLLEKAITDSREISVSRSQSANGPVDPHPPADPEESPNPKPSKRKKGFKKFKKQ